MSLAMDPAQTVDVVLPTQEGKDDKIVFIARHLTARQRLRHSELMQTAYTAPSIAESLERVLDAIMLHVIGWRNKTVEFSRDALLDTLTVSELDELAAAALNQTMLTEAERKNFVWQSRSRSSPAAVESATAVAPA